MHKSPIWNRTKSINMVICKKSTFISQHMTIEVCISNGHCFPPMHIWLLYRDFTNNSTTHLSSDTILIFCLKYDLKLIQLPEIQFSNINERFSIVVNLINEQNLSLPSSSPSKFQSVSCQVKVDNQHIAIHIIYTQLSDAWLLPKILRNKCRRHIFFKGKFFSRLWFQSLKFIFCT